MRRAIVALLLVGCASVPPRSALDIVGTAADRRQLAGVWRGTFETPEHTHDGTIEFGIDDTGSAGDGTVLLTTQNVRLRVIFVRIRGSEIAGALEPYHDQVCNCTVYSTFSGRLEGSEIRGEFVMKPRSPAPQMSGTWFVKR